MRRMVMSFLCLLVCAALLAPGAGAQRKAFVFDKAHSQINFTAEALFLTAHGYFGEFDGDVQIDPQNVENSAVTLVIDVASINTRNDRRDNHLRSADFFDAANNPKITFATTKITKAGDNSLTFTGNLTIRGVTKVVEVPARLVFMKDGRVRVKGEFKINRKEYGVNYNSPMNPIEDMVAVEFDVNVMDRQIMEERRQRMQQQQQQPPAKPPL